MNIHYSIQGSTAIITIKAKSLVKEVAQEFKDIGILCLEKGAEKVDLDLGATEYIDSSGIGKLLFFNKKLQMENGTLEIIKISKRLYQFFESLAITSVIDTCEPSETHSEPRFD